MELNNTSFALPKVPQTLQPDVDPIRETPVFLALLRDSLKSISRLMMSIMHGEPFAGMPRI